MIMTEQDKKYLIEALEYALDKCNDVDGNAETHYNTLANAIEVVKNCSIPNFMRSVFLVVHPDANYYGDRHVEGVFDSKNKAEDYIFKKGTADWEIDDHEINPN